MNKNEPAPAVPPYRIRICEGRGTESLVHHPNGSVEFVPLGWATIRWMWNLIKTHPDVQITYVSLDGKETEI